MRLFSPCKINLKLKLTGKRSDGYHGLETIMQTLSFGDQMECMVVPEEGKDQIISSHPEVPLGQENILFQALQLFREKTQEKKKSYKIWLNKKIPMGAGLGGGSSNGMLFLKWLVQSQSFPYSEEDILAMGAAIGSDTNFFFKGGTWLCGGRGEKLISSIKSPTLHYLLFVPPWQSPTGRVYQQWSGSERKRRNDSLLGIEELPKDVESIENWIENDLEEPYYEIFPQGLELKKKIEKSIGKPVFLTGSGSTLFSIYQEKEALLKGKSKVLKKISEEVKIYIAQSYNNM